MEIIIKSVFSKNDDVSVLVDQTKETVLTNVSIGDWMGVCDEEGDFFYVLTKKGYGWVRKDNCESELSIRMMTQSLAA